MFKETVASLLEKELKRASKGVSLKKTEILKHIEVPPQLEMGDYSFPCFPLAKSL